MKREREMNTLGAQRGLSSGVFVQSTSVYLGDPPVPAGRQAITGAAEIIIQQAAG